MPDWIRRRLPRHLQTNRLASHRTTRRCRWIPSGRQATRVRLGPFVHRSRRNPLHKARRVAFSAGSMSSSQGASVNGVAMTHRVSRSSRRTAIKAARGRYANIHRMAYLESGPIKSFCQRRIFADRPRRKAADRRICRKRDRKAGAGRYAVVRPGIMRPRIAPRVDFCEIAKISVFQAASAQKFRRPVQDIRQEWRRCSRRRNRRPCQIHAGWPQAMSARRGYPRRSSGSGHGSVPPRQA